MCLPANATTNHEEHYWLVLGWHEILSIWHKQSLVTFLLFLWHSPFQDRITDCQLHFNCSQKKHLEFKESLLIHQEPGNLPHELTDRDSRPECDIAPRIWHGGRTEDVPGIARCPLTSLRVSRGCSVSRLSERRDRISPRPDTLVTISELGSLKAKSNHFLLDLIVIHIVCLLFIH